MPLRRPSECDIVAAMANTYTEKTCQECGIWFTPNGANSKYCSVKCRRGTGICELCSTEFIRKGNSKGKYCSTECFYEHVAPTGSVRNHADTGYKLIKVPKETPGTRAYYGPSKSRWMFHHRFVMQEALGRPLRDGENVHHINGDKADNRIENLELWDRPQPIGVRSDDSVPHCSSCTCLSA